MYQVPLTFVEVSPDLVICATRIVAIMSTASYQARETIKAERKAGTLINGCGNRAAESCVFLDNGSVISSPYTVEKISRLILKADEKAGKNRGAYSTDKVTVIKDNRFFDRDEDEDFNSAIEDQNDDIETEND